MGNRTIEKDPNLSPRNYLWGVRGMESTSHGVVDDLHYALSGKGMFLREIDTKSAHSSCTFRVKGDIRKPSRLEQGQEVVYVCV